MGATSSVATVVAVNANIQANAAQHTACVALLNSYNAQTATIEHAKQYAHCVTNVYPDPISNNGVSVIKGGIIAFFLFCIIGGIITYKMSDEILAGVMIGAGAFFISLFVFFLIGFLIWG